MAVTTTTLVYLGLAATAIGGGISAYGSYQAGKTNAAIASFNALVRLGIDPYRPRPLIVAVVLDRDLQLLGHERL